MTGGPSVSIVIPTFNRPDFLRQSIVGALAQTSEAEVVVVDHGSSPETAAVAAEFGRDIRFVRRDVDSGPIFAWLDGVLHASGEYINLHFDDDVMEPTFLERCMPLTGPSVGMVFSAAVTVGADGAAGMGKTHFMKWFPDTGVYPSSVARRNLGRRLVSPCAAIHRRSDVIDALYIGRLPFQRSGYHGVGPDYLLQQLALLRYPLVGFVREPLVGFRAHPGSITVDAVANGDDRFGSAYREVEVHAIDLRLVRVARRVGLTSWVARVLRRRWSWSDRWTRIRRRIGTRLRRFPSPAETGSAHRSEHAD